MSELRIAQQENQFWKDILGVHYGAFFDEKTNKPGPNFMKIQHLHVWDTLLSRFPNVKIVWAHVGLSKELQELHPLVHKHILTTLLDRYSNLHADVSWDVLSKMVLMDYKPGDSIAKFLHTSHEDFDRDAKDLFNQTIVNELRQEMHDEIWMKNKDIVHKTGSKVIILVSFNNQTGRC